MVMLWRTGQFLKIYLNYNIKCGSHRSASAYSTWRCGWALADTWSAMGHCQTGLPTQPRKQICLNITNVNCNCCLYINSVCLVFWKLKRRTRRRSSRSIRTNDSGKLDWVQIAQTVWSLYHRIRHHFLCHLLSKLLGSPVLDGWVVVMKIISILYILYILYRDATHTMQPRAGSFLLFEVFVYKDSYDAFNCQERLIDQISAISPISVPSPI